MRKKTAALAVVAGIAGITSLASAATVAMSGFDQVAQIVAEGGSVSQIGGGNNGGAINTAAAFVGGTSTTTGVGVSLPSWTFAQSIVSLADFTPVQTGNISSVLLGAPTDITYTLPGAGGPDGTAGDGSFSFSAGQAGADTATLAFGGPRQTGAGETKDLWIFTDTDGGGAFDLEILAGGMVVDSALSVASAGGSAGAGTGGIIFDLADGLIFDAVRITGVRSLLEVDAVAVQAPMVPLPTPALLTAAGLAGVAIRRQRR